MRTAGPVRICRGVLRGGDLARHAVQAEIAVVVGPVPVLKACQIAGSPGPARQPAGGLTRESCTPGGMRNSVGGAVLQRGDHEIAEDRRGDHRRLLAAAELTGSS